MILVFGTFDLLHPGHLHFLNEAAGHGRLVVALTPDELCLYYKGKKALNSYAVRRQRLLDIGVVSEVTAANDEPGKFLIIDRLAPRIVALGYDQEALGKALLKQLPKLKHKPKIIRLKPYRHELYQSSKFRNVMPITAESFLI